MVEDRSLDEFAGSDSAPDDDDSTPDDDDSADGAEESTGSTGETDATDSASTDAEQPAADPAPSSDDVEPATTTSAWDSDGVECERCDERTERRWIDDGALVCADCKAW